MTPTERILTALADHNCDPKRNGKGWSALCPAHDDRRPSLSIAEGSDGPALVDCKAGCATQDVVAAVGLTMRDLFRDDPSTLSTSTQPPQTRSKRQYRRQANGKAYPTARDAVVALDSIMAKEKGKRVAYWTYADADGGPVAVIVRYDLPTPKGAETRKDVSPSGQA